MHLSPVFVSVSMNQQRNELKNLPVETPGVLHCVGNGGQFVSDVLMVETVNALSALEKGRDQCDGRQVALV